MSEEAKLKEASSLLSPSNLGLPASPTMIGSLGNIANMGRNEIKGLVAEYIKAPFDVPTPKEKVKKRPDGLDYVEGSWMDTKSKEFMPLYEYKLLHISHEYGWINVFVSLTDRTTGNTELGAGAARIQVFRGVETPSFRDIIDMGNNLKAALTQAIKNAQSRFGICADVYGKRESVPTDDERARLENLINEAKAIDKNMAKRIHDEWLSLGTEFDSFLAKYEAWLKRKSQKESSTNVQDKSNGETKTNVI